MDTFSLNSISLELARPHKNANYTKLKYLQEHFSSKDIQKIFFQFIFDLIMDCISLGNKIVYICDEVIYMHKDGKHFKYHSID
jgi:hypothetical protein